MKRTTTPARRALLGAAAIALAGLAALPGTAAADSYPSKAVRLIIPFPAGGVTDLVGRLLAEKLTTAWGQTVVVENRAGASGMIGADYVAKSQPDGYTLMLSSTAEVAINQNLYAKMSYSPEKDLAPVTLAATTPVVLVTSPALGVHSLEELKKLGKQKPGTINFASAGSGGVQHMAGALLETKLQIGLVHVPYRGGAPSVMDLLAGHVDTAMASAPLVVQYIHDKKLIGLAVAADKRMASLPDVPTANEALSTTGFEISNWYGIFAPAGTPADILDKINADIVAALKTPELQQKISEAGAEPVGNSRKEFTDFWHAEIKKYADIIRESGAKVD